MTGWMQEAQPEEVRELADEAHRVAQRFAALGLVPPDPDHASDRDA